MLVATYLRVRALVRRTMYTYIYTKSRYKVDPLINQFCPISFVVRLFRDPEISLIGMAGILRSGPVSGPVNICDKYYTSWPAAWPGA